MGDNLPPLPPYMYGREVGKNERVWSEQCMRAYAEEAVRQEREACALIVDAAQEGTLRSATAAAIRARSEQ